MGVSRSKARRLAKRADARAAKLDAVTKKLGGMLDEDATKPYDNLALASKVHSDMIDAVVWAMMKGATGSKQASQALADSQAALNPPRLQGLLTVVTT